MKNIASRIWAACAAGTLTSADQSNDTATSSVAKTRVLLVHGIADSAVSMRMLQKRLARDGRESLAITLRPGDGSVSLEVLSLQLRDYVRNHFSPNERFDLVGFSMGGLVCRHYVQLLEGRRQVDRLITISSPNHGTLLAFLNNRVGCKEMRPGSTFLQKLNHDCSPLRVLNLTSFWTPLDLIILPAKSSRMPFGINQEVRVLAHPLMILQRKPLDEIAKALSQPVRRRD
jgi:triacylglycerol lipase